MGIINYKKKLIKKIKKSKTIFIMGHKNLDLDAIGSCIGLYNILEKLHKECYIIVEDINKEEAVSKVLSEIEGVYNIVKTTEIPIYSNKKKNKNLLIVVDTNKTKLLNSRKALEYFDDNIIVIDHHEKDKDSIEDGLIIIDDKKSSASEIIVDLANVLDLKIDSYAATMLLSGIVLDTNNFSLKITADTFYNAYYLTVHGASPKKVQYLLKEDINKYIEQQKLLTNIEIIGNIAIAKGSFNAIYRKEDLAKVADTLLFFDNIELSFVIGNIDVDTVGISARSLGNYNVSEIMKKLNGGGDILSGATEFNNKNIKEVTILLKKVLRKEGE